MNESFFFLFTYTNASIQYVMSNQQKKSIGSLFIVDFLLVTQKKILAIINEMSHLNDMRERFEEP